MIDTDEAFAAIRDLESSLKFLITGQSYMLPNNNNPNKEVIGFNEIEGKVNKYLVWNKACEDRKKQLSLDGKPELKEDIAVKQHDSEVMEKEVKNKNINKSVKEEKKADKEDSSNFNPKTRLNAKDVFKWVKEQNLSNEETLELVMELLGELKNKDGRKVRDSDKSDGRG